LFCHTPPYTTSQAYEYHRPGSSPNASNVRVGLLITAGGM
jgi:hypothetical protein